MLETHVNAHNCDHCEKSFGKSSNEEKHVIAGHKKRQIAIFVMKLFNINMYLELMSNDFIVSL